MRSGLQIFKLCERWGLTHEHYLYPHLDLCAISIAADIVHVTGENRLLAHHGMQRLRVAHVEQESSFA